MDTPVQSLDGLPAISSIDDVLTQFKARSYVAERGLATAVFLALRLGRPLFLEGEAGVGKTEVAKVLADLLDTRLIRLQCYEGLDVHSAVYEWNYTRQLLEIRLLEAAGIKDQGAALREVFSPDFLIRRPLLQAIAYDTERPPVLLVDELDRADEEFEAFLLEMLSDFQITIPELGTVRAPKPPVVILTSNRTREIHDALKRRCLYYWIDYPSQAKELQIVESKVPAVSATLARQITAFIHTLRTFDLYKLPGVAETLDWAASLVALDQPSLTPQVVDDTLGVILKYQDDVQKVRDLGIPALLERARLSA
ncbi:MAG: MoxR family ATPase [Anaerolineae bacterium]